MTERLNGNYNFEFSLNGYPQHHGWASAELPRNRINVNLFLRHIRDLSRKRQTKVGTLACFCFLNKKEITM